jgi:hypothetical protein
VNHKAENFEMLFSSMMLFFLDEVSFTQKMDTLASLELSESKIASSAIDFPACVMLKNRFDVVSFCITVGL